VANLGNYPTVSPVKEIKIEADGLANFIPLYNDTDFSNLDVALKSVAGQSGARLLLKAGNDEFPSRHVVVGNVDTNKEVFQIINSSVHIRGEKVNRKEKMPKIEAVLIARRYVRLKIRHLINL